MTPTPGFNATPSIARANLPQTLGFGLIALYVFLIYSRLHDFVYYLHLPMIILTLAALAMLVSGALMDILRRRMTRWILAMTACLVCAIPLSVWPGGAADQVLNVWLKSALVFLLVSALVSTPQRVRQVCGCIAFGSVVPALFALHDNSTTYDRLASNTISGNFADANEFAQLLLIGMCLLVGYASKPDRGIVLKVFAVVGLLVELMSFLRTGSRGGFIGLMVVILTLLVTGSARFRAGLLLLTCLTTFVAIALLPSTVKDRYAMVFGLGPSSISEEDLAAQGSAEGRTYLLKKSISITAQNPLLGVGPGMFAVAENSDAKLQGLPRGMWHETHNMYTQISSEAGIPAVICFIALIVCGFKELNRVRRLGGPTQDPAIRDAAQVAYWLRLALVGLAASGFFLSIAYGQELYILLGLAAALGRVTVLTVTPPLKPMVTPVTPVWQPTSRVLTQRRYGARTSV